MQAETLASVADKYKKGYDAFDAKLSGSSNIRHWNAATGEWTEISVIEARKQQAERRAEKERLEMKKRQARYISLK
jgi:hypothetical protein